MKVVYGPHALATLAERAIEPEWVERTLSPPERVEPGGMPALRALPERDGRVLRVVEVPTPVGHAS